MFNNKYLRTLAASLVFFGLSGCFSTKPTTKQEVVSTYDANNNKIHDLLEIMIQENVYPVYSGTSDFNSVSSPESQNLVDVVIEFNGQVTELDKLEVLKLNGTYRSMSSLGSVETSLHAGLPKNVLETYANRSGVKFLKGNYQHVIEYR